MPRPKSDRPGYYLHRQSGRACTVIDGKQKLLPGPHGSDESRAAYDALVGQWLGNGRKLPEPAPTSLTVSAVAFAFWKHAQTFYRQPDGTPTGEAGNYRGAIRALRRLNGTTPAKDFGPKMLRALRAAMLLPIVEKDAKTGRTSRRSGWSRTYANRQVDRVKAVFRWAASEEMIPATVPAALGTVDAIRAGREGARETEAVEPVADELVDATLPHMPPPVAALVKLQRLTGARGGELFKLRAADIDTGGPVWKFRPARHKTAHKGHRRVIRFGPQAREVLEPFLTPDLSAYLFAPAAAVAWRNKRQAEKRRTPMTPSQRIRAEQAAARQRRKVRTHYTKDTYARAVARACEVAFGMPEELRRYAPGVRPDTKDTPEQAAARTAERERLAALRVEWHRRHVWSPHQLRHAAGTAYRQAGDFEVAKIILGHQTDSMTQHYARRDDQKADEVVARIG